MHSPEQIQKFGQEHEEQDELDPLDTQLQPAFSEPGTVGPWTYETGESTDPISDRFILVGRLARTSTSEVYFAHDMEIGETVAFKSYYDANDEDYTKNDWERKLLLEFQDDPTIVSPIHIGEHDQQGILRRFLVTHLATGGTLRETRAHTVEDAAGVFASMRDVAAGVESLRDGLVLHQDIKPGNAFVYDKRVVIGDLGTVASTPIIESDSATRDDYPDTEIVRILGEKIIRPRKFNGYVPPEAHKRGEVDPACDVYALGAMTSEMLTGVVPRIEDRHWDEWIEDYVDERRFTPDSDPINMYKAGKIPKSIVETTYACLDVEPQNRPSPSEVRESFEAVL